jgi:hypothetical protein
MQDVFFTFVALCQDPVVLSFFEPGQPGIVKFCRLHTQLLESCLPRLANHLVLQARERERESKQLVRTT